MRAVAALSLRVKHMPEPSGQPDSGPFAPEMHDVIRRLFVEHVIVQRDDVDAGLEKCMQHRLDLTGGHDHFAVRDGEAFVHGARLSSTTRRRRRDRRISTGDIPSSGQSSIPTACASVRSADWSHGRGLPRNLIAGTTGDSI